MVDVTEIEKTARYGFSGVRHTYGTISFVAIVDKQDNEAAIAFVPFNQRHPPLKQPDVDLIVSALNSAQAAELEALREGVVSQNSMRYLNLLLEAKRMGYESISEAFSAIDQLRARVAALEEGLRDFCLSAECAAGVDEGASEDVAESEIMSFAGSALAVSYSKARALLNHNGEAG